jgi:hypothetical protein
MHYNSHPHSKVCINIKKRSQTLSTEQMESTCHSGCWDRGAYQNKKDVGTQQKERHRDFIGKEEEPVIKDDAYPNNKGKQYVHENVSDRVEKFEPLYESFKGFDHFLRYSLGQWLE